MLTSIPRIVSLHFFLILALCHVSCESDSTGTAAGAGTPQLPKGYYHVKKVVDGDTFWVDDGSPKGMKIRLIGVDAPESRKVFKKEKGYFGTEAKGFAKQRLSGQNVRLEFDVDSLDRYGRTLAYVFLEDSTFFNAELVKEGFALIMTVPPNVKYADHFVAMQIEARDSGLGLWANLDSLF